MKKRRPAPKRAAAKARRGFMNVAEQKRIRLEREQEQLLRESLASRFLMIERD